MKLPLIFRNLKSFSYAILLAILLGTAITALLLVLPQFRSINSDSSETTANETAQLEQITDQRNKARADLQSAKEELASVPEGTDKSIAENNVAIAEEKLRNAEKDLADAKPPSFLIFSANIKTYLPLWILNIAFSLLAMAFPEITKLAPGGNVIYEILNKLGTEENITKANPSEWPKKAEQAIESKIEEATKPLLEDKIALKEQLKEMQDRMELLRIPAVNHRDERYSRVLILGVGEVGKTELITNMLLFDGNNPGRPESGIKTGEYKFYYLLHQSSFTDPKTDENTVQVTALELMDFRGQSIGKLQNYIAGQKARKEDSYFDSILLIVDLFKGGGVEDGKNQQFDAIDEDRVKIQCQFWDDSRISSFLELAENPRYFCLIINKFDLLKSSRNRTKACEDAYASLFNRIRALSTDCEVDRIVTSITRGTLEHTYDGNNRIGGVIPYIKSKLISRATFLPKQKV